MRAETVSTIRVAVIGLRGVPHVIGGIESHCEHLYPELVRRVPELRIRILARRRFVAARHSLVGGAEVLGLRTPGRHGGGTFVYALLALFHARFRFGARIVHLHGIGPGILAPLVRLLGMRPIVTHHAADFHRPKWSRAARSFLRWGERFAARFAVRVVCVSDALCHEFLDRYPAAAPRTQVIRHSAHRIVGDRRSGDPEHLLETLGLVAGQYVLAVGRFDETKRFGDLIAARAAARPDAPPLVIVGASVDDDSYERRLREAAGDHVVFAGFRANGELDTLFRQAALLIHPSEMEGFGLVVLEALAVGTPVAASDIPVHREFGLPERCYFTVGDVAALTRIIDAVTPRSSVWHEAEAIAARYDDDASMRAYAALFRSPDLTGLATMAAVPRVSKASNVSQ